MACERFCFYTDCGITACGSGTPTKLSNNSSGARAHDNRNHSIIKKLMDVIPICSVGSMFYKQMFVLKDLLVVR